MARGNKASRDAFIDIKVELTEFLIILTRAIQRMPKIERIEGAGTEMKRAAYAMVRYYHKAWYCKENRTKYIEEMIGWYGCLQTSFELAIRSGIIDISFRLPLASRMERIEGGVMKWHKSRSSQRQERGQCRFGFEHDPVVASDSDE